MNTNVLNKKKLITSIIFKAISLIASVYGLVFTIDSIKSFTFFTTLSNVALDIVLAVFIVLDVILLTKEKDYKSNGLYILKFLMTLSITLTCLVYMIILGPTSENGLIGAYLNKYAGSLGVHKLVRYLQLLISLCLIRALWQRKYMQYMQLFHHFAMLHSYTYWLHLE